MLQFIFLFNIFSVVIPFYQLASQEHSSQQRVALLEKKLAALEDYLKKQLEQFHQTLESQQKVIIQLQKQNALLTQEINLLRNTLKQAEIEILKLKTEIPLPKNLHPPDLSEKIISESKSDTHNQKFVIEEYTDPRVAKAAQALKSSQANVRLNAIVQLSQIVTQESTLLIQNALTDTDPYVKILCCKILAQRQTQEAIPKIFPLLYDTRADVFSVACKTIEKLAGFSEELANIYGKEREAAILKWQAKLKEKNIWKDSK